MVPPWPGGPVVRERWRKRARPLGHHRGNRAGHPSGGLGCHDEQAGSYICIYVVPSLSAGWNRSRFAPRQTRGIENMDMDWSKALQDSLAWLAVASAITVVAFAAVAVLLVRFTRWGRQFWQLAGPFLHPRNGWWPTLVFALLLVLSLISVRMNVLSSFWYNGFYSALQELDQKGFWRFLGIFAVLATIHVMRELFNYYVNQAFRIDRKSTRLNSSHGYISYAVFCLKKKNSLIFVFHHDG